MIEALALILICQLAGEVAVLVSGVPVPGPVLGMLLLLGWLWWRDGISERVAQTADTLLGNFSLLFVPAGVGVMIHWGRVQEQWGAIAAALLIGTPIAILVTALTMAAAQRLLAQRWGAGDE